MGLLISCLWLTKQREKERETERAYTDDDDEHQLHSRKSFLTKKVSFGIGVEIETSPDQGCKQSLCVCPKRKGKRKKKKTKRTRSQHLSAIRLFSQCPSDRSTTLTKKLGASSGIITTFARSRQKGQGIDRIDRTNGDR
jgi:hypothetical protein